MEPVVLKPARSISFVMPLKVSVRLPSDQNVTSFVLKTAPLVWLFVGSKCADFGAISDERSIKCNCEQNNAFHTQMFDRHLTILTQSSYHVAYCFTRNNIRFAKRLLSNRLYGCGYQIWHARTKRALFEMGLYSQVTAACAEFSNERGLSEESASSQKNSAIK